MKIMTVLGTRPEIIRLSRVVERLDMLCQQVLVNTGQNSDPNLNEVFFRQLAVRPPDLYLNAQGGFGEQISIILRGVEEALQREKPDRFLVLGDTNSALAAVVAKRLGVEVYHMEAGNRCYDDRVPEEVNRRLIDHCSDVLMPYTERSRQKSAEGRHPGPAHLRHGEPDPGGHSSLSAANRGHGHPGETRPCWTPLLLGDPAPCGECGRRRSFGAIRPGAGCTPSEARASDYRQHPSAYPTPAGGIRDRNPDPEIRLLDPFGFFEFVALEQKAACVLSDSGTVQEECSILKDSQCDLAGCD